MRVRVKGTRELPLDRLQPLFAESAAQRWHHLARRRQEWEQGVNRFHRAGEAIYLAHEGEHIVGVVGLSQDPYAASSRIGHVRRVYVLASSRRRGVGRALVDRVVLDASQNFSELRLRAGSAGAAVLRSSGLRSHDRIRGSDPPAPDPRAARGRGVLYPGV